MENLRMEFLRILVDSHLVESVLKCLDGVEIESLTVRNVQETRYECVHRTKSRFVTAMVAQMDIFACHHCREKILSRIDVLRKPLEMEVTCQVVRSSSGNVIESQGRSLDGLDLQLRQDASQSVT